MNIGTLKEAARKNKQLLNERKWLLNERKQKKKLIHELLLFIIIPALMI